MLDPIELEPVDALTVQVLMDNVTDATLLDTGPVKRANFFSMASGPHVTVWAPATTLCIRSHARHNPRVYNQVIG